MAQEVTSPLLSLCFDDQIKKLENTLTKFKDLIPQNENENQGEQLHCFGPHNLYLEQENINEMFNNMVQQYQKFTASNTSAQVSTTKLTNEKLFLSNQVNPLKATLQGAMSKIRDVASDTTLKTTVLKLEAISIEEGLRFDYEPMNSNNCFISCDMFYVEAMLDSGGQANDVILHGHNGETKSCKELLHILRKKDYKEFRSHLQGLKNRYLLKGHTFYQTKILSALEALEEDIVKIMKSDMTCNIVSNCIRGGPVGYVIQRDGGKNLQMTYLADPLLLLDLENQGVVKVFSLEEPLPRDLGYSAVLSMRQAPPTYLPVASLVIYENNTVCYTKQDKANSEEVPACFVLNLTKPLPASVQTTKLIDKLLNKNEKFVHSSNANLDDLILQQYLGMSRKQWEKEEFVIDLSDQSHIFTCIPSEKNENVGLLLSCIPFTHPLQLPPLIKLLRHQAMYNILLCSCVNVCNDVDTSVDKIQRTFHVTASSWNNITVTFIHPIDGTIASVDFVLSTECYIECTLNTVPGSPVFCTCSYMNTVINRSLSIPISMRSILKKAESYKPEMDKSTQKSREKKAIRPIKLQMPSLAQIQSEMPLMSPHLLSSPSTFLNFSPGAPLFMSDPVQKGTISKKRTPASGATPLGTPNSDGSRTPNKQKLPKIKLKRKRVEEEDSEIYVIDQTNSEFGMDVNTPPVEKPNEVNFSFTYSQSNIDTKNSQSIFTDTFSNVTMEGDTDLDGLLGIPSEPFSHGNTMSTNMSVSANIAAFDLDAITSGRDVTFETIPSSIIDPSALVKSPDSFDMDSSGMIDIDSLMNT